MEEISKLLKASNMSLDQSQAKRIPLNATRYPSSCSKACMFDNLGATPYTSPTKPGTKGKERAASSSQGELDRKRGRAHTTITSRSKSRPADESDDDLLLTESSAHGSPSKATPLSDLDGDSDAELKKVTKFALSKHSTLPMRGKETRRVKSSPKHPENVKSLNSLDLAKRQATQKMKPGVGVGRKGRRPEFKVQRPAITLEVSSALPKEVSKTTSALRVDPLSQLLKEKEECQTKEECTPKPIARIKPTSDYKAGSNPSTEATRAASTSRTDPLAELLKEKKDCNSKEDSILRYKTRSKPDAKGKGKATSLQPFPMDSPPLTRTTKKGANESDDADPLQLNDMDEITTRGGLRPFPMSSQDFEGMKKASKPSSNASSSSSKRGSSPHPDEWAAKRRRKTNGMLEDYEFADISMTQFEQRDPKTLCPFCDLPMPESPSPLLQDMLDHLKRTSYPDPRPTNSLGRRAPLLNYISLCQRHQFETKLLPKARAKGWPSKIDFEALPSRVARLKNQLRDFVQNKEKSIVWKALKKEIERKGIRRVMGLAGQFEGFKRCQPGYYGEQGAVIIYQALYILFPNVALDFSATAPLSYTEFVQCVLVPEVAASLVQEDMGLKTRAEALEVLEDSSSYGVAMFPDNENEEDGPESRRTNVGERMIREHVKLRRKEVDDEDLLDGLELSKPVKAKKVKRKPTRTNNADDLGLFSSDSTTTQSETSHKKTKNSLKSSKAIKVTSSPDGKENMHRPSSSSQTLVSVTAEGKSRPKYAIHTRPDVMEDLDATPRPIPPSKKSQATKPNTDTNRMKNPKDQVLNFESKTISRLTGLSNPLQMARSRKIHGVLPSQSSPEWRYNMMANELSEDDAEGPPSSSLPQRSQTTSLTTAAKGSKRPPSNFERKDSQWLLSDGPTPDTTPRP